MKRFVRGLRRQWARSATMEGFVRLIVTGGVALVVGLWLAALTERWSAPWLLGTLLVLVGLGAQARGISSQLEW